MRNIIVLEHISLDGVIQAKGFLLVSCDSERAVVHRFGYQIASPQQSIGAVTSFVFSSCDFVDRSFCPEKQGRSTKSHEPTRTKILPRSVDVIELEDCPALLRQAKGLPPILVFAVEVAKWSDGTTAPMHQE